MRLLCTALLLVSTCLSFALPPGSATPAGVDPGHAPAQRANTDGAAAADMRTGMGAAGRTLAHTALPILAGSLLLTHDIVPTVGAFSIGYGILAGPSMGNFYLEDYQGGLGGIALRAGGGLAMGLGMGMWLTCALSSWGDVEDTETCDDTFPLILAGTGIATFVGGTVWNWSRLPAAARAYSLGRTGSAPAAKGPLLSLAPTLDAKAESLGLRLSLRY